MPHLDDDELRQIEQYEEFLASGHGASLSLTKGTAVPFKLPGTSGSVTLLEVKTVMYAAGGCGNCLGIRARIEVTLGNERTEADVGPQRRLFYIKKLRMALGEADIDKGTAVIVMDEG